MWARQTGSIPESNFCCAQQNVCRGYGGSKPTQKGKILIVQLMIAGPLVFFSAASSAQRSATEIKNTIVQQSSYSEVTGGILLPIWL